MTTELPVTPMPLPDLVRQLTDTLRRHLCWPEDSVLNEGGGRDPLQERLRFLTLAICGEAGEAANNVKKQPTT